MADSTTRQKQRLESSPSPVDNRVSAFLEAYTIPLQHSRPYVDDDQHEVFVFWSQNDRTQYNPSSDDHPGLVPDSTDDPSGIHHKLEELFRQHMHYCYLDGLIQFWSIVKTGSRRLLATDNQPFALKLDSGCLQYRLRSHEYKYNIDPITNLEGEEDPFVINVFRSHLAEVIIDLRVHQGSPLVNCALECGLMSCFLIPICDASQTGCVGVLECCAKDFNCLIQASDFLAYALKNAGLRMFKGQKDFHCKTIGGLEHINNEIKRALEMACESHPLTLAHVSINYEDENRMKRMVALTLLMRTSIYCYEEFIMDYCDCCDMLPVKIMEGLTERVLENYKPHSCRNIYNMSNIEQTAITTMKKFSCLVICLKSITTGDHVDYVFEFVWPQEQCYQTIITGITVTLKGYLPNFKFACGAKLGDELRLIDVGKFSESGIQTILELFKGKKLSPIPKVSEEG